MVEPESGKTIIGWREYVALPDWGVPRIRAKADTGARTSAVDVDRLEEMPGDRVRFDLIVRRCRPHVAADDEDGTRLTIEADIIRRARVKSSLGAAHTRPIVQARVRIGGVEKIIDIGLVSRRHMTCRMLLGRSALEPDIIVDCERTYLHGKGRKRG
jgi:hypothetical protein